MVPPGSGQRLVQLALPSAAPVAKRNADEQGGSAAILLPSHQGCRLPSASSEASDLMASVDICSTDLSNCLLNPCKRGDLLLPLWPAEGCKSQLCCISRRTGSILPAAASLPLPSCSPEEQPAALVFCRLQGLLGWFEL